MFASMRQFFRRLRHDRRGNVFIIVAFAMLPMTFATGMGIDYSRAARLRTKLNALADAAALSAVTRPMMDKSVSYAQQIATNTFNAQAATLSGLVGAPVLTIAMVGTDTSSERKVTVSYTADSVNAFGGILGRPAIRIGGSSTASAAKAPNMDFYLALDTSPSMALPTTTAGFQTMDGAVKCAFACHSNKIENYVTSAMPSLILDTAKFAIVKGSYGTTGSGSSQKQVIDEKGSYIYVNRAATDAKCKPSGTKDICVYNADGTYADSYWYALNKGVQLRVTDERNAIRDLMTLAQSYAVSNKRTYHAGLYTFDHSTNAQTIASMPSPSDPSNLAAVSAAVSKVDLVTVNDRQANGCPPSGCTGSNKYLFTSFKSILDKMATTLPAKSGQGSDAPGDTPQAFLFLVTDGMSDEDIGSGRTRAAMQNAQVTKCSEIKDRGVKIAILYTEYTVDSIKDDEPGQRAIATAAIPNIAPQLTRCASPGLMYTVKTDESISNALQELFTKAIATAHLTE